MIIHDVEQGSDSWHALRAGLPTASEFSKIVTSTGEPSKSAKTYAVTLAAEAFAGKPVDAWEGNQWTERGKEQEGNAIALYEFSKDVTVERVGFVTDDHKHVGCSPDGFVGESGLIEVKCLKAENHVLAILRHQKDGTCEPKYIQQPQGQMMICEREWCDLVFFHPELPLLVIRQKQDLVLTVALQKGIHDLRKERDLVLDALKEQAR